MEVSRPGGGGRAVVRRRCRRLTSSSTSDSSRPSACLLLPLPTPPIALFASARDFGWRRFGDTAALLSLDRRPQTRRIRQNTPSPLPQNSLFPLLYLLRFFSTQVHAKAGKADEAGEALKSKPIKAKSAGKKGAGEALAGESAKGKGPKVSFSIFVPLGRFSVSRHETRKRQLGKRAGGI